MKDHGIPTACHFSRAELEVEPCTNEQPTQSGGAVFDPSGLSQNGCWVSESLRNPETSRPLCDCEHDQCEWFQSIREIKILAYHI